MVSFLLAGADVLSVQSQFVPTLPPPQSPQPELAITEENAALPVDNDVASSAVSVVQPKSIVISTTERERFVPTLRPKKKPRTRSPVREVRITTTERVRFVPANGRRTPRTTRHAGLNWPPPSLRLGLAGAI